MKFEKERISAFYRRLISLYPQGFRERFGESMEQTFNDVCNERMNYDKALSFNFVGWFFFETVFGIVKENFLHLKNGITMENTIVKQKKSALIGLILALPFILTLLIVSLNLEPLNHYLQVVTTVNVEDGFQLNAIGKVFFISTISLLPVGFVVSFIPLVRVVRNGKLMRISPLNLLITAVLFVFTTGLLAVFVS